MASFEHRPPSNETEFQSFMEAMDCHFAELGMPVPVRELASVAEVCHALGEQLPVPSRRLPRDGVYSGEDLIIRAIAWYNDRYGDRLKVYFGPGHGLAVLRGELWVIEYPGILGRAGFHAGDLADGFCVLYDQPGHYQSVEPTSATWLDPTLRKFDVLDFVRGLPDGLRSNLQRGERVGILRVFCENRLYLHSILMARHYKFVEEARADLESAVSHIMARPPATGLAKWASMHALEKMLKSLLDSAHVEYPTKGRNAHDPRHLYGLARDATGLWLTDEMLTDVQCTASVRYDFSLVTVGDAVRAHSAAIRIGADVASVMRKNYPRDASANQL